MKQILILLFTLPVSFMIAQSNSDLIVKNRIDHVQSLAREPMVCQHPNGDLFVTGYKNSADSPQLWKSKDTGKMWEAVAVGTPATGAVGNSDVDMYIDKKGNIYLLSMTYTKLPANLDSLDFSTLKGERISVGVSRDEGETWRWQTISENDYDDRPWITATSDGTLHIIWNDGSGVHHAASQDEGETWQQRADITEKGGSSFLASGPQGQLAVRVAPLSASAHRIDEGVDFVELSTDNGETWKDLEIPGNRTWTQNLSGIPRWVEPLTWDSEGTLYLLWTEGTVLKMGTTKDEGNTWTEYDVIESVDTMYFPYMETSPQGVLCTWVSGFQDEIRHHAALVRISAEGMKVDTMDSQRLDIRSRFSVGRYERSTGGEYFPIIPLRNGNFGMTTTIQNSKAEREGFTWWELVLSKF